MSRRSGKLFIKVDGALYDAVGSFTYNLGADKREGQVGPDGVHGFKVMPQIPYIEGEFRDGQNVDVQKLLEIEDATVTLELANGKVIVLKDAWYAADGDIGTEDGNIQVRFEGVKAEEVR